MSSVISTQHCLLPWFVYAAEMNALRQEMIRKVARRFQQWIGLRNVGVYFHAWASHAQGRRAALRQGTHIRLPCVLLSELETPSL